MKENTGIKAMRQWLLAVALASLPWAGVQAQGEADTQSVSDASGASIAEAVKRNLARVMPRLVVSDVRPSDFFPGLYAVGSDDGSVIYTNASGSHVIANFSAYNIEGAVAEAKEGFQREFEERSRLARAAEVGSIDVSKTINFAPEGEVRGVAYVFTDESCGYCRKLHSEMAALNARGIEVRYLAYPRGGRGSAAYAKMASAWCSSDQLAAMDSLKRGQAIPQSLCKTHPVDEHYALGNRFGVRGTPAILLEDGELLGGYMPAQRLAPVVIAASQRASAAKAAKPES